MHGTLAVQRALSPQCPQVTLNGPADVNRIVPVGIINLESGVLNLVATQFSLDREHANQIIFIPEQGMDPVVDVVLASGDLRAVVQVSSIYVFIKIHQIKTDPYIYYCKLYSV